MAGPRVRSKSRGERVEQTAGPVMRQWEENQVQYRTSSKEGGSLMKWKLCFRFFKPLNVFSCLIFSSPLPTTVASEECQCGSEGLPPTCCHFAFCVASNKGRHWQYICWVLLVAHPHFSPPKRADCPNTYTFVDEEFSQGGNMLIIL